VDYLLYNESKLIVFSVYNVVLLTILLVIVEASLEGQTTSRTTLFVLRSIILLLTGFITVCTLFIPKIYYVVLKVATMAHLSSETQLTALNTNKTSEIREVTTSSKGDVELGAPEPTKWKDDIRMVREENDSLRETVMLLRERLRQVCREEFESLDLSNQSLSQ